MPSRALLTALAAAVAMTVLGPAAAGSSQLQLPEPRIQSGMTRIDKHYRFDLRIKCIARKGEHCKGFVMLSTGEPALHLEEGIPLAGPHDYTIGAGRERRIHLKLARFARPERSRWQDRRPSRLLATTFTNGGRAERWVKVYFKPPHRGG